MGESYLTVLGVGEDGDGEYPCLVGQLGDYRSRARTGASSHSGGDEYHLNVRAEGFFEFIDGLESGFPPHLGIHSGSATPGQIGAEHYFLRYGGQVQGGLIRVAYHEFHILETLSVQTGGGVAASSAHAYDFDDGLVLSDAVRQYIIVHVFYF